jgi:hypothetical protein
MRWLGDLRMPPMSEIYCGVAAKDAAASINRTIDWTWSSQVFTAEGLIEKLGVPFFARDHQSIAL